MDHTQDDALLRGIRENPDDDLPRLVYADWLQENDQEERARFIRLQCEAEGLILSSDEREELSDQVAQLFVEHARDWVGEIPGGLDISQTRRGFWDRITLSMAEYPDFAKKWPLHRLAPAQNLTLTAVGRGFGKVLTCPELEWVTSLELTNSDITDRQATMLARSAPLRGLKSLWLGSSSLTPLGVTALLGDDVLPYLKHLSVRSASLYDSGLETLADLPNLARLRRLYLGSGMFGSDGIIRLIASPHLCGLEDLALTGLNYHDRDANIQDEAILALADPESLPELRDLSLCDLRVRSETWARFADSPLAARLRQLDLSHGVYSALDDSRLGGLFAAGDFPALERLSLQVMGIKPADVNTLVRSPLVANIRVLDLSSNTELRPEGARLLADSPPEKMTELGLNFCRIGGEGLRALCGRGGFTNLRRLGLCGNGINSAAVAELADSGFAPKLRSLELFNNPIGDAGLRALGDAAFAGSLRVLHLGACGLTDEGIEWLADSNPFPRLRELIQAENPLSERGVRALLESPTFATLSHLMIHPDDVGAQNGVERLQERFGPCLYLIRDEDY